MRTAGKLLLGAFVALVLIVPTAAQAAPHPSSAQMADRNVPDAALAGEFLRILEAKDQTALARFLAPQFLLQRPDGTYLTRDQYLLNPARVDDFTLTDVAGTRTGDVRVIRYTVNAVQFIDGRQVTQAPVPRISTYIYRGGAWRLVAHANFAAVPQMLGGANAGAVAITAAAVPPSSAEMTHRTVSDERLATEFLRINQAGDAIALERLLAPAFLIQRADGTFLTKAQYLTRPSKIDAFAVSDVHGTTTGNVRVIRYTLVATIAIDGKEVSQDPAPRLSTFVWRGGAWRLLMHANFAAIAT
jgi:hypothetical protein